MHIPRWVKRTIKWTAGTITSFVLLISCGLYFFHDEIVSYAIGEINKNLKAKVEVSKVDITFWKTFPNLSLDFHHVFIPDALPGATHQDTLLYTEMIRMKFDPMDVWNEDYNVQSIDIAPGTLQLKVDNKGRVNYDIVKERKHSGPSAFELTLEAINMENMRFVYSNALQEQTYATTFSQLGLSGRFTDERFNLHTEAAFRIHRIQNGKIPFIVNQPATTIVDIEVDQVKNTVSLPNGLVHLAGLPFHVKVFVDSHSVQASVNANNLALKDVANHLSVKEAENVNRFQGSGTASFSLELDSELGADAFPLIDCRFSIKNGRLVEPSQRLVLNSIALDGNYSTVRGRGKEELNLNKIAFSTVGGPFHGNLAIRKFSAPRYTGKANGSVDLAVIHSLFRLPKIRTLTGNVKVDTKFVLATLTEADGSQVIDIEEGSGSAVLSNVQLQLLDDARQFEHINGKLILDQHQAALENLSMILGRSDMLLNGHFDQIDRFLQDKSKLEIEVIAQSRRIDLADFNSVTSGTPIREAEPAQREWLLPTMIDGSVRLDVGTMILDDHRFLDIHGNMAVGSRSIRIEQLFGRNAEASVQGTLAVVETAPEYFEMATSLSSRNIRFSPLFKEWHNFDQNMITADNISGKAEVTVDFKAPFDMRTGVLKNQIVALIQLKVTNGNLKNVSAFNELTASLKTSQTRLILRKNEIAALDGKLNNISFETLENTIYIKNSTIIIPSMVIASSAIDITTEGTHTFGNDVDYKFAFRFRDLKVQKDESEFGEVVDDGTGIRIYVRLFGPLENPTIEWDKKARKEQQKENRTEAKNEAISILKTEFGFKKNDTTVKQYVQKTQPHEELRIQFGQEENVDPVEEKKKTNKLLENIKKKTDKLKEGQPKKEIEFEVD